MQQWTWRPFGLLTELLFWVLLSLRGPKCTLCTHVKCCVIRMENYLENRARDDDFMCKNIKLACYHGLYY